jgi:hypothetical protein
MLFFESAKQFVFFFFLFFKTESFSRIVIFILNIFAILFVSMRFKAAAKTDA